jgi:micrococcal nuclease
MYEYKAQIINIIDGDTFEAVVDLGFNVLIKQTFRVLNYDAPETFRPKSEEERRHGELAKNKAIELLDKKIVKIKTKKDKTDKYGRYLADIDLGEKTFSQIMISENLQKKETYLKNESTEGS